MRLWRWFKYIVLTLTILTVVSFFFLLTSNRVAQALAEKYAPLYDIDYQRITGTLLGGIEAEKVTFKNNIVADKLTLTWDLFSLLNKKINLHTLTVEGLHANNLQVLLKEVSSDENSQTKAFPFFLNIETVKIAVNPFEQSDIGFRKIVLQGKKLEYDNQHINLSRLLLEVDSNVTTIQLEGNIHQKKIRIAKLDILDIDTKAFPNVIKNLIAINFPQEVVRHVEPEIEDYKAHRKHLLPRSVQLDRARIQTKSEVFPQFSINKGEWRIDGLFVDIYGIIDLKPRSIQYGNTTLLLDTNLSTLSMESKWKKDMLTVSLLSLKDVDTKAWKDLLNTVLKNSTGDKKRFNAEIPWKEIPYLPKALLVKKFEGSLKSVEYGSFTLESTEMNASHLLWDLPVLTAKKGEIDLSVVSNYGNLKQHSTLKKEKVDSKGTLESSYLNDLSFEHKVMYGNNGLQYKGDMKLGSVKGIDHNLSAFLHDLNINFEGDTQGFEVGMENNESQIDVQYAFTKKDQIQLKVILPQSSSIHTLVPKLNVDAITPIDANLSFKNKKLTMAARAKQLDANVEMNTENRDLQGKITLDDNMFTLKGNVNKEITLQHSTKSLKDLFAKVNQLYTFTVPPLDGDATLLLSLRKMRGLNMQLSSNTLTYMKDPKTIYALANTKLSLDYHEGNFTLNHYTTQYKNDTYYANRPSHFSFQQDTLTFAPFWLNNTLKITGKYSIRSQKGALTALADSVTVPWEKSELKAAVDLKTEMNAGATDIKGKVTVLGGNIDHDINLKTFATDRDIINIREEKKKKKSPFLDKLTALVNVRTDKAFHYHNEVADIHAKANLLIQKGENRPLSLLGNIEIKKGSSYLIKKKKLIFEKSYVSFAGDVNDPYLDIALLYKTLKTKITMQIRGKLSDPTLSFHSIPYMNKRQILSTILFDTQENIPDIDEDKMVHMMGRSLGPSLFSNVGGAVVKSVFSNLGINVDRIPFVGGSREANMTKKNLMGIFSSEKKKENPSHFIHFSGQKEISEKALQKAMGVKTRSFWKFWTTEDPHIDDKLLPTLKESLENFYDSEGFYDAKISLRTTKSDVYVHIKENLPVQVKSVEINSDHKSAKIFSFKKGERFRAKAFVTYKREIANALLQDGYCSYDMDSKAYVDLDRHTVDLRLTLKKGGVCTFGKVTIKKFGTINNAIILSRLRAREGERFNTELIKKTYDALYGLEAFDSILLNHDRKFYNVTPLEVEGKEISRPWFVKGEVDYDTEVGFRFNGEVLRTNFMGNAKSIRLAFTYSKIEKEVALSYFVPALLHFSDYYLDLTSKIGYRDFEYTGFVEKKKYARSYLSYNNEKWHVNAGLAAEDISISPYGSGYHPDVATGGFSALYPFVNFSYDSRIFHIRPRSGYYLGADLEYALPYSQEASTYLKYTVEGSATFSFNDFTFSTVGKAGVVDQKKSDIPESKRFFAGGYGSNRAYGYQRVGVTTSPTTFSSEGGSSMANLTFEAAYTLNDHLYGLLFMDNTMLTKDAYDFNGDVLSSLGLGLYYVTPIAPIRIDMGMNLQDSSQYAIHFQLGESF